MNKLKSMDWAAKLIDAINKLPENADIHGFSLILNTDTKPYHMDLSIHLSGPVDMPAVIAKRYSGWHEARVYTMPDVYAWWAEDNDE